MRLINNTSFLKNSILLIIQFVLHNFASAQSNFELGSWNILNVKYTINPKWSFFIEGQIRSLRFYDHFHYHEIKGGINHQLTTDANFTLAAGNYQTYGEGGDFVKPRNNNEIRIWPQLTLYQKIHQLKVEQRYRSEFRFTNSGYRNRFRYRVSAKHAFGPKIKQTNLLQVGISNELFFTNREPYFERNRLHLFLDIKLNQSAQLQIGYLHQFDYKINDETGRDFLTIGYFYDIKKGKKQ